MDTVIAVKHTVYAIAWLAVNQSVCRFSRMVRYTRLTSLLA